MKEFMKRVLGEKGQDMVEYALMLAIIVGIGWLIYQQAGLQDEINQVFTDATTLISSASDTKTAT